MTNEERNIALYNKMLNEFTQYKAWLLNQPPEMILEHCYQYAVREDILVVMENNEFSDRQCDALLKSSTPLADILGVFENSKTSHMRNLEEAVETCANAKIRADFVKSRQGER